MSLSFDTIPDDLWEDWKWFVYPEGLVLGMREGKHRVPNSSLLLTPCYVVNVPKLIMSEVMWASRYETTAKGLIDTGQYLRRVNIGTEDVIDSIIFLLSQNPMVVTRKTCQGPSALEVELNQALQDGRELILMGQGNEAERQLSLDDLKVEFFNPFEDGKAERGQDLVGRVSPEGCSKELSMAKVELPSSMVRDAIAQAMDELSTRGLIMLDAGTAIGMTKRGQERLEIVPVSDTLACKCEVELVGE
jgi:hypothetical protein